MRESEPIIKVLYALAGLNGRRPHGEWVKPTTIGLYLGRRYSQASSYACPILKRLVRAAYAERNDKGHYRVTVIGINRLTKEFPAEYWGHATN